MDFLLIRKPSLRYYYVMLYLEVCSTRESAGRSETLLEMNRYRHRYSREAWSRWCQNQLEPDSRRQTSSPATVSSMPLIMLYKVCEVSGTVC